MSHPSSTEWLPEIEGQLSVDVFETSKTLLIRAAIAGVAGSDLTIHATTDTVTIRGTRTHHLNTDKTIIHLEECYWGPFSRSVILPSPITPEETKAILEHGVLTITLKKAEIAARIPVLELEEENDA